MAAPFNPFQALVVDLNRGALAVDSEARLLVPAAALAALCEAAGEEAARDFGQRLGAEAGRRAQARLKDVNEASISALAEHLGGELALMGLGDLSVERWGRALVLKLGNFPLGSSGKALACALLEGALQRATSRSPRVIPLELEQNALRCAVLGPAGAEQVRDWLGAGVTWADALARLQRGAA